jgi:hypothetical protein
MAAQLIVFHGISGVFCIPAMEQIRDIRTKGYSPMKKPGGILQK